MTSIITSNQKIAACILAIAALLIVTAPCAALLFPVLYDAGAPVIAKLSVDKGKCQGYCNDRYGELCAGRGGGIGDCTHTYVTFRNDDCLTSCQQGKTFDE
jgi:hypothetical protein